MGNQLDKNGGGQQSSSLFKNKQNNQYKAIKDDIQKACKCSYKTRIIGYVACFATGWLLSIVASMVFFIKHNIPLFAILFSIGQVLNISGSCFLATPKTQAKDMFAKKRLWFTLAYLLSTIVTIVLAVVLPYELRFLVIVSLIIEAISYFFYTLSYIPFGRKILAKICNIMID